MVYCKISINLALFSKFHKCKRYFALLVTTLNLNNWFIDSLIDWLNCCLFDWLIDYMIDKALDSLTDWLIHWWIALLLDHWFAILGIDWLIDWLNFYWLILIPMDWLNFYWLILILIQCCSWDRHLSASSNESFLIFLMNGSLMYQSFHLSIHWLMQWLVKSHHRYTIDKRFLAINLAGLNKLYSFSAVAKVHHVYIYKKGATENNCSLRVFEDFPRKCAYTRCLLPIICLIYWKRNEFMSFITWQDNTISPLCNGNAIPAAWFSQCVFD